ncbi:hypothetical protein AGMMS50230_17340 [Spirochaetia bacterium]|nr:hypothetical protein AGMMS50230_17340 [Spirochaetia bacterium]
MIGNSQKMLAGAVLFALMVTLSACFSPYSGKGETTLTLNLGGGGRQVISSEPADLDNLRYEVTLSGPGEEQKIEARGRTSISAKVVPGTWQVTIKAYYQIVTNAYNGELLYAYSGAEGNSGPQTVEVEANGNNNYRIRLYQNKGVFIFPKEVTLAQTDNQEFRCFVIGTLVPNTGTYTINWSLDGESSSSTTIDDTSGVLVIGSDETATFTVSANVDSTDYTDMATVTVVVP